MSNRSIEDIYDKALELLELRFHSVYELQRKLEMRTYPPESIKEVIEKLTEQGFLDDQRFAENYLENLIKYKTFGFYGLKAKLLQRGIKSEIIGGLLSNFSFEDERQIALKLIGKKKEKDRAKLARSLSSKGFRSHVIADVLKEG